MFRKWFCLLIVVFAFSSMGFAQLGIRAGINMSNEIKSFSKNDIVDGFKTENLTGYHLGLNYQMFSKKKRFTGTDIGLYLSQKGFTYTDSTKLIDIVTLGYKEINYLEMPINFRFRFSTKIIGVYGTCGLYGGYVMAGKSVNETENSIENLSFQSVIDRIDYGYSLGGGLEFFKKIQFGLSWTQGLKNLINNSLSDSSTQKNKDNRVFSVNLTYIIK